MKKVLYTISLLSIGLISFMYFSKPVNALIDNGVDYRILETGTPIEINAIQYNPIVINEDYAGERLLDWVYYMQVNNIHRVSMTAPKVSTLYIYYGTTLGRLSNDVFKIELNYDTGFAYFYMILYSLNEVVIDEVIFANTETHWEVPSNTRVLTNINFQDTDDVYSQAYNKGYDKGYDEGRSDYGEYFPPGSSDGMSGWYSFQDGYDYGYEYGMKDYGYNDNGIIIPGQNAYDKGYAIGIQESGELKTEIINFVPGVLGSIFMFFFQLGQIGILGITILDILGIIVLISGLIFLIKFFF